MMRMNEDAFEKEKLFGDGVEGEMQPLSTDEEPVEDPKERQDSGDDAADGEKSSSELEKMKRKFVGAVTDVGNRAAKAAGNARNAFVRAVDKNDDGKLDLKDISILASRIEEKREKDRREKELNSLRPVFRDTVTSPEFVLSKLIRVAEIDKKHADSELCKDSIGFSSEHNGVQIITIYPEQTDLFGLSFYPDNESGIYYVDPCNRNNYIAMDAYFKYLRLARVNELQMIAQALGARHFKVTYIEQDKNDFANKVDIRQALKVNMKGHSNNELQHESASKEFRRVEVAAEMECLGHDPVEPTLTYLKSDPNIEALIKMRLNRNAPIHQKVSVNLLSSSGIKVADAAKIDDALNALHFTANASVQREAQNESRTILEYEIDY